MIQSTNSHVRRLMHEKSQYEDELKKAKDLMKHRMQGILLQCKYFIAILLKRTPNLVSILAQKLFQIRGGISMLSHTSRKKTTFSL